MRERARSVCVWGRSHFLPLLRLCATFYLVITRLFFFSPPPQQEKGGEDMSIIKTQRRERKKIERCRRSRRCSAKHVRCLVAAVIVTPSGKLACQPRQVVFASLMPNSHLPKSIYSQSQSCSSPLNNRSGGISDGHSLASC